MGLRDTEEQLDACREQSVRDERTIEDLRTRLDERRAMTDDLRTQLDLRRSVIADLERQNAELEHDLARAESALADRLRHDAHTHQTAPAAESALLDLCRRFVVAVRNIGYTEIEGIPLADVERRLDAATRTAAECGDGVLITAEEAQLAARAARHSAAIIRALHENGPDRLDPTVLDAMKPALVAPDPVDAEIADPLQLTPDEAIEVALIIREQVDRTGTREQRGTNLPDLADRLDAHERET